MSPLAGRFLGRDPIGYFDCYSLYSSRFVQSYTDPGGLCRCCTTWHEFNETKPCHFQVPEYIDPNGVVTKLPHIGGLHTRRFDFDDQGDCSCACCRMRQFIVEVTADLILLSVNGMQVNQSMSGWPQTKQPGEDCVTRPDGTRICPGDPHWDSPGTNEVEACRVRYTDRPGLPIATYIAVAKANNTTIVFRFKQRQVLDLMVFDTCQNDRIEFSERITHECDIEFTIDPNGNVTIGGAKVYPLP